MIIKGGNVFCEDFKFTKKDLYVSDGVITDDIEKALKDGKTIDASGKYVIPGLIDIHSHGAVGHDFCDASEEGLKEILAYERSFGVTSYCPTSMTLPYDDLEKIFETAHKLAESKSTRSNQIASIVGINMEGPFISVKKKGAQKEDYIKAPDPEAFEKLFKASGNLIKLVTLAPETEGAIDFIIKFADKVNISIGHTDSDYNKASEAFTLGANHVTHLFNAMPPFHHRNPGVIGAAMENENVFVEVICDGIHIHPSMIRNIYKMFGCDRIVLISDSMEATGMPDGEYMLGGQKVYKKKNLATLSDETLAGSVTNLFECMKNAVHFGIDLEDAVKSATVNPAKSIGEYPNIGSLNAGSKADILLLDEGLNLACVITA